MNAEENLIKESSLRVHIKLPGKKAYRSINVSETETIGDLTRRMAKDLGIDEKNWGFYAIQPDRPREFLADNEIVYKISGDGILYFIPRIIIR